MGDAGEEEAEESEEEDEFGVLHLLISPSLMDVRTNPQ